MYTFCVYTSLLENEGGEKPAVISMAELHTSAFRVYLIGQPAKFVVRGPDCYATCD